MAEKLASWVKYQKVTKEKVAKADMKNLKDIVEKNTIDVARAGLSTEAILSILIEKKILSKKEVMAIVDQQLKKNINKK